VKSRRKTPANSNKSSHRLASAGPDFVMMLAEPEIRLLMQADNVNEGDLLKMLKSVSVRLRKGNPDDRKGPGYRVTNSESRKYRRGVGILLVNQRREIFIARRNDVEDAWQMPQGGIDSRESPEQAAFRELKEEIGTDNAKIVAASSGWFYYDVPEDIAKKAWGGRWKGQRQKWFVMLFTGIDEEIDLATEHPEFDAWRWATIAELSSLAVTFKRDLYASLLEEFSSILQRAPNPEV
jgi:8-oxo-dGTP pyrophosphatase MutT (NUDIX family)